MLDYIFKHREVNRGENTFDELVFEEIWPSTVLRGWYTFSMKAKTKENGEIKSWKSFRPIGKLFWYSEHAALLQNP